MSPAPGNGYPNQIKHIQPNEPVNAGVASRPDRALDDRTNYLKQRLDAAETAAAIFDYDATVSADVAEGDAVYWNATTQQYEQALAGVYTDVTTGALVPLASADCLGLCYVKVNATLATIVLYGLVEMPHIGNAIVNGGVLPGRYYLSSQTPGAITLQRPPVTVPACIVLGGASSCDTVPRVLINPQTRDFQGDHVHYRIALVCRPAGETSAADAAQTGRHVIFNANSAEAGWLPANDPSFSGRAPVGAAFGYNLAAHPALSRVWPPVPLQSAALLWDKGQQHVGATEVPLGRQGLVVCDSNGIWWMSDCLGDIPWPDAFDNTPSSSYSLSVSSQGAVDECPRQEEMRVEVVFLRMLYANDYSVVTSLQPATGSPITVSGCDGTPAKTGDLRIGLDLGAAIDPVEAYGGIVFKQLESGFKFKLGHVVEGLVAGSDRVNLSATRTRSLNPLDDTSPVLYQDVVTVDLNPNPSEVELDPQIVRLDDAVERLYQNVPYIGFRQGVSSGIRARYNIPPAGLPANSSVIIRALLLARASGTLPELTMSYAIIPQPVAGQTPALPAAGDTTVDFPTAVVASANDVLSIESDPIPVNQGDTLLVTIARGNDTSYLGELGIIRAGAILNE